MRRWRRCRPALLDAEGRADLARQGMGDPARLRASFRLHLRTDGTDAFLPVPWAADAAALSTAFGEAHRKRFGFAAPARDIVVEAAIAEVTMPGEAVEEAPLPPRGTGMLRPLAAVKLFAEGSEHEAPVFDREALRAGDRIAGPALIREPIGTVVVKPGCRLKRRHATTWCCAGSRRAARRATQRRKAGPIR